MNLIRYWNHVPQYFLDIDCISIKNENYIDYVPLKCTIVIFVQFILPSLISKFVMNNLWCSAELWLNCDSVNNNHRLYNLWYNSHYWQLLYLLSCSRLILLKDGTMVYSTMAYIDAIFFQGMYAASHGCMHESRVWVHAL